jgi:prepilin-type N-terminal cleavage/methylation domain-containing protein
MRRLNQAFTLTELLVAIAVLVLVILLVTRLLNDATALTTLGHKRMDADANARPLFDRIAVDFAQMVKRKDVSYYVKTQANVQAGNDQIAFYSMVTGYYPTPSKQSPVSLVCYRINSDSASLSYNKLERMGKGLIWNGASATHVPILFRAPSAAAPTTTIENVWPAAANNTATDSDYELAGPQVFRFEYYYLLSTGALSDGPWPSLTAVNMSDVAAIVVAIAVVDPKSKLLLTDSQISAIAGTFVDYAPSMGPGQLLGNWQSVLDGIPNMPRQAISGVRLYERYFYLSQTP